MAERAYLDSVEEGARAAGKPVSKYLGSTYKQYTRIKKVVELAEVDSAKVDELIKRNRSIIDLAKACGAILDKGRFSL